MQQDHDETTTITVLTTMDSHQQVLFVAQVECLLMQPGDVAFMHSNTLHASAPNKSEDWRRNIIVAYNAKGGPRPAAAHPMDDPYCSCKLTPPRSRTTPKATTRFPARQTVRFNNLCIITCIGCIRMHQRMHNGCIRVCS